jgi:hypothetical protein
MSSASQEIPASCEIKKCITFPDSIDKNGYSLAFVSAIEFVFWLS